MKKINGSSFAFASNTHRRTGRDDDDNVIDLKCSTLCNSMLASLPAQQTKTGFLHKLTNGQTN